MVLTPILGLRIRTPLIFPCPAPGPQLSEQTFCRREQFFKTTVRFRTIVSAIEDGDLKADFRAIPAFRRIHDPMHRRFGILARFQKIQRLKEHATETMEFPHQLMKLGVFADRHMAGILKGGIEVELKTDLDDAARPILHIERSVIEADFPRDDHVPQCLLAGEGSLENQRNGHG